MPRWLPGGGLGTSIQTAEIDDGAVTRPKLDAAARREEIRGGVPVAQQVGAGATVWVRLAGQGSFETNEARAQMRFPKAGTLKNLYVSQSGALANTMTYLVRKNGADTLLVVAIGANTEEGADTTNTVAVAADDDIGLQVTNASGGSVAPETDWYLEFEPSA